MTVKELRDGLENVSEAATVKIVVGEDSFIDAAMLDAAYVATDKQSVVLLGSH